jgi:hypothetical protein
MYSPPSPLYFVKRGDHMIMIQNNLLNTSEKYNYLSGMMPNMQYIRKYPPLYEVERGTKGVSIQVFRIVPQ